MLATAERFEFAVPKEDEGRRLDQVLARHISTLSRRRVRVLLDIGGVFVDGVRVKTAGRAVRAGQILVAHVGGALLRATKELGQAARERDAAALPPFQIVHIDEHIVVVDKPAGLLTAPTPESDRNNLADLLARGAASPGPVYVVHRLDLPTSGLLVLARSDSANRILSERFRVHDIEREYLAVVAGVFPDTLHSLEQPIAGRSAVTRVRIEERLGELATVLRCNLKTGRTHQIRIHMHGVGHAVLGDPERPPARPVRPPPPRMALHATRLGFVHPSSGTPLLFESPWPADLAPWLAQLRAAAA